MGRSWSLESEALTGLQIFAGRIWRVRSPQGRGKGCVLGSAGHAGTQFDTVN